MRQLTLELSGYPRPIAWTLSEVERAKGDRDRHNMLLTALEEITRYLVMVQLARYTEYAAERRRSAELERCLADLRRPSFGHYVAALGALDEFLAQAEDPYAIDAAMKRRSPAIVRVVAETGTKVTKVSILGFLGKLVELRNQTKGHGYTDQEAARIVTAYLQPALIELLNHMPLLIGKPLVWIEQIEYIDVRHSEVTMLELMGTHRARRLQREVQDPGNLKKGFLYMWDGESSPLQLTPFLHLDQAPHDERVYVLSRISGEPVYQARGATDLRRRPDQLMSQLEERAPFLLKRAPSVTTPRLPDATRFYRHAVAVALADGGVTTAEDAQLEAMRLDLGLAEGEAAVIHAELGWHGELVDGESATAEDDESEDGPDDEEPEQPAAVNLGQRGSPRALVAAVREKVAARLAAVSQSIELNEDVARDDAELWIQLGGSQVVSVWLSAKRGDRVRVVVGFYSTHDSRDPRYRKARKLVETTGVPSMPAGWHALSRKSTAASLALESWKRFALGELGRASTIDEVAELTIALTEDAAGALAGAAVAAASGSGPLDPVGAPVSAAVPDDFALDPLDGTPRIQGSVWKARILWALEWARRHEPGPKSAADIARILTDHGVRVPGTNTARAFRVPSDDPRVTGLVEQEDGQRYVITTRGRRALFELVAQGPALG